MADLNFFNSVADVYKKATKPTPSPTPAVTRDKQKKSIEDEYNQPDPVGDWVRKVTGSKAK